MGYRSCVQALIYGDPLKVDQLCMKFRHTDPVNLWTDQAFGRNIREWTVRGEGGASDVRYLHLSGDGWKWYTGYEDVDAWIRFQDLAEEMGLSSEFVRVGEETDDIETRYGGDYCQYLLDVSRTIECAVSPPDITKEDEDVAA